MAPGAGFLNVYVAPRSVTKFIYVTVTNLVALRGGQLDVQKTGLRDLYLDNSGFFSTDGEQQIGATFNT